LKKLKGAIKGFFEEYGNKKTMDKEKFKELLARFCIPLDKNMIDRLFW